MITLFYAPPSCATVAHIALEESGLPFETRRIDFQKEDDVAELRRANPRGTVPAAFVDGVGLTENIAIISYVAALAPDSGILPTDPLARAQCIALLSWSASTVHPNFRRTVRPERYSPDETAWEGIIKSGRTAFWDNLVTINARLECHPWMLGEAFSAADGYALRFYEWGLLKDHPVKQLSALNAFIDRMKARPAVHNVLKREGSSLLA